MRVEEHPSSKTVGRRMERVFLPRVPPGVQSQDLKTYFSQYGEVTDAYMPVHPATRQPKGMAFVTFETAEACAAAVGQEAHAIAGAA